MAQRGFGLALLLLPLLLLLFLSWSSCSHGAFIQGDVAVSRTVAQIAARANAPGTHPPPPPNNIHRRGEEIRDAPNLRPPPSRKAFPTDLGYSSPASPSSSSPLSTSFVASESVVSTLEKRRRKLSEDQVSQPAQQQQQRSISERGTASTGFTIDTANIHDTQTYPPDSDGAVGPTQIIVAINGRIRSFNKETGDKDGVLDFNIWYLFEGILFYGEAVTDPRIRYDRHTGLWFVTIASFNAYEPPNRVLIAVSSDSIITSSTTWNLFAVPPSTQNFCDFPTLGIDVNALYITCLMFTAGGGSVATYPAQAIVVQKQSVMGPGPVVFWLFPITEFPSDIGDGYTYYSVFQGVDNFDPSPTYGYFIGTDPYSYSKLQLCRVANSSFDPTWVGCSNITLSNSFPTRYSIPVQHAYSPTTPYGDLDSIDDRLSASIIRNGVLWTSHNFAAADNSRVISQAYKLTNLAGNTPQVQTYIQLDMNTFGYSGYNVSFWIPSVMPNGQGNVAIGGSFTGPIYAVAASYVYYLPLANALWLNIAAYSGWEYNPAYDTGYARGVRRWGDYSMTAVDPEDDMTIWTFQEWVDAANSYSVEAVQILAPPPPGIASVSPTKVNIGQSLITLTVTGQNNSVQHSAGFYDPGSNFPKRLTAQLTQGVDVLSVAYIQPLHINLTISTTSASPGVADLTVYNPDGQFTVYNQFILCGTIVVGPQLISGTVGTAYNWVILASGSSAPYSYTLSGTLPTGLSLSGSNLKGTPTVAGNFSFSLKPTDANGCTGTTQSVYLVVCASGNPITVSPAATIPSSSEIGSNYSVIFTASGGSGSYSFTSLGLPSGLTLSSSGQLSGVPTTTGFYSFTIFAYDTNQCVGSRTFNVSITCSLSTQILPSGLLSYGYNGEQYNQLFTTSEGEGLYSFSTTSGGLPPGLSLSAAGNLSGIPTKTGYYNFSVTAQSINSPSCQIVTYYYVHICPVFTFALSNLTDAVVNSPYSVNVVAVNGMKGLNYTISVVNGALPDGLAIVNTTTIAGTPLTAGVWNFTITATITTPGTALQCTYTQVLSMVAMESSGSSTLRSWFALLYQMFVELKEISYKNVF